MLKNFTLVSFLTLTLMGTAVAQNSEADQMKDPKAKAILDKLSKKNKSYSTIVASFEYNLSNKDAGIDETQTGTIKLKGDKYNLEMAGQQVISDGEKIYTYIPEVEELQIKWAEEDEEAGMISPSSLFTMYEKGFNYKYDGSKQINGETVDLIKLFPENADKPYHTAILQVTKSTTVVRAFEMRGKDGNTYTFTINNFTPNKPLNDNLFNFDKSKAADVIDFTE